MVESLYVPAPKLNQLHLLIELCANTHITQAELSRRCGLSVAMVNNYMKELCRSGLLEYHRKSSKTVSYHVTPSGQAQVDSVQGELLRQFVDLFAQAKQHIRDVVLPQMAGPRLVLYGSGDLAQLAFHALSSCNVCILGICVEDRHAAGREWCAGQTIAPEQIPCMLPDAVVVADQERGDEICRRLTEFRIPRLRVIRLDGHAAAVETEPEMPLVLHSA